VLDRKLPEQNGNDIAFFYPDVISYTDYMPFGMEIESRSETSDFDFGFNGMYKDDEMKGEGNSYDFGARMYDPRVGRWLSLDPMARQYPHLSPYNFVANNPIIFTDANGEVILDPKTKKPVVKVNGEWKTVLKTNEEGEPIKLGDVSDKFVEVSQPVLDDITSSNVGEKLYDEMQASKVEIIIDTEDEINKEALKTEGGNSKWSPLKGTMAQDKETGLYKSAIIITPDVVKLKASAKTDGIDYEEKLLQTISVEFGHVSTKEQIDKEKSYDYNLFKSPEVVEDVYGDLLNEAIRIGKEYRVEKEQDIDETSNYPVTKVNEATGSEIEIKE
ncbi:MAG: hypothetical protein COA32_17600, partial [Fluviicola sp.]